AHCCGDHVAAVSAAVTGLAGRAPDDIAVSPIVLADGLSIRPRASWGADLAPNGSMRSEDVRFLLVHHTASEFGNDDPVRAIRSVYAFHTGPAKRWPDVAYNFFVAPDGSVWEGRAGSLDGPVEASATGGNQGFAQLVCLIGNHVRRPPTLQAQASLVRLLAWLCGRYGLGVHAGASATFTSRGSNRFPSGSTITTPIISPHRAVTFTACPGDAAVALLADWRRAVFDLVSATWERDGLQRASRLALGRP
ncbi:MAG: N-acetylmuramoyl-L-alanine amidase, partial [Actinomycetota bacterium]